MQSADLKQIYDSYWNWTAGGLAIGVAVTSLLPFLQEIRRKGDRWHWPSEPLRSVSQLFLILAAIYPLAGIVGKMAESPCPGIIYSSLSIVAVIVLIAHTFILSYQSKVSETAIHTANERVDGTMKMLTHLQAATDIDAVFDRPSDPLFVEALARDLRQTNMARVVMIGHGSLDEWPALWKVISGFAAKGGKIRVISDAHLGRSALPIEYQRVPDVVASLMQGVFAIDCSGPFYFGIGPVHDDLVVARFDGRSTGRHSLASGVFLLTNHLSHLMDGGINHAVIIRAATSPAEYKDMILGLESEARCIDRIPKRLFVIFKSTEMVRAIAEQRYGNGSIHIKHYVEEHNERATRFFAALGRGMICREIYNKSEVIAYIRERKHGRNVSLTIEQMKETVMRWRDAVVSQPNYMVGLTDMPLPFKYELIDGKHFVMHEAVGQNDEGRMNAFCISGTEFGKKPMSDFEIIWNNIPASSRVPKNVAKWIEKALRDHL